MRRVVLLLLAGVALAGAGPQASLADIEDEVMCDVCNVALNIAESPRADQQRAEIRDLIAQGMTKQEVLDTLEDRYGPAILAMPQDEGFSLAVYVVPVAVVVALVVGLLALLPRWRRRAAAAAAADPAPTAALSAVVVALVAGLLALLPRWRRRAATAAAADPTPTAALSAVDARRLDDDLARYRG